MLSNFVLATSFAHAIKENDNHQRKWFSANELSTKWKNHFWVELNSFKLINTFCLPFADINECETGKHRGDSRAFCNNTKGLYNCTCKPGYFGNGFNCTGKIVTKTLIAKTLALYSSIFSNRRLSVCYIFRPVARFSYSTGEGRGCDPTRRQTKLGWRRKSKGRKRVV